MTSWRYETPVLSPTDPLICHSIQLRPDFWGVLFNEIQRLSSAETWRKGPIGTGTPEECAAEFAIAMDNAVFSGCIMIGQILELALDTIPAWLLPCDGGTYARDDYPELYAVIHANLKQGPDFFLTPDRVARFGIGGEPVASQGGESSHSLTEAEMPLHSHVYNEHVPGLALAPGELPVATPVAVPIPTSSAGFGLAHNNMPPYEGTQFYIVARYPGVP